MALVLANWENVLSVIRMVGSRVPVPKNEERPENGAEGEGDKDGADGVETEKEQTQTPQLPVPLVRIPVQPKTEGGG